VIYRSLISFKPTKVIRDDVYKETIKEDPQVTSNSQTMSQPAVILKLKLLMVPLPVRKMMKILKSALIQEPTGELVAITLPHVTTSHRKITGLKGRQDLPILEIPRQLVMRAQSLLHG
jgi:hypothetical protein